MLDAGNKLVSYPLAECQSQRSVSTILVEYEWFTDGSWQHPEIVDNLPTITVPLPDGTDATIEQLPVNELKKTLGIWTNPAGYCQN